MDVSKVTGQQEEISARHSRMVGKILALLEAAIPEGSQCDSIKRLVQIPLYDFRNEVLHLLVPNKE